MSDSWWRVDVPIEDHNPELISSDAWDSGAIAIWEQDAVLCVGFENSDSASRFASAFGQTVTYVDENFNQPSVDRTTLSIGEHELELFLDSSKSFGHGQHPTTSMVLNELEKQQPGRLLDIGSGTGIISITAAKFGFEAVAVDNDPNAVEASRANALSNNVDIEVVTTLEDVTGIFDVVCANLLLVNQRDIAEAVRCRITETSVVILAGFTTEQANEIRSLYSFLTLEESRSKQDWVCLTGRLNP